MLATAPQLSGAASQQQRRVQKAKPVKRVIAVNLPEDLQTIESVTSTFYPYGEILLARVLRKAFKNSAFTKHFLAPWLENSLIKHFRYIDKQKTTLIENLKHFNSK